MTLRLLQHKASPHSRLNPAVAPFGCDAVANRFELGNNSEATPFQPESAAELRFSQFVARICLQVNGLPKHLQPFARDS